MKEYKITIDQSMSRAGEIVLDAESDEAAKQEALRRARADPSGIAWRYGEDGAMEVTEVDEAGPSSAEVKARELVQGILAGNLTATPFREEIFRFRDESGDEQLVTHDVNLRRRFSPSALSVLFAGSSGEHIGLVAQCRGAGRGAALGRRVPAWAHAGALLLSSRQSNACSARDTTPSACRVSRAPTSERSARSAATRCRSSSAVSASTAVGSTCSS